MTSVFDQFSCQHPTIELHQLSESNTTYINCKKCQGYLSEFRNDIPEKMNFDKLIAKRLYIFGDVYELTEEQKKKWR